MAKINVVGLSAVRGLLGLGPGRVQRLSQSRNRLRVAPTPTGTPETNTQMLIVCSPKIRADRDRRLTALPAARPRVA
jgi:hypothetical protein